MKNVLPVALLALANVARNYTTKKPHHVSTQNPEYMQKQKGKKTIG